MNDRFNFRVGFNVLCDGKEKLIIIDDSFSLDNGGKGICVHVDIIEDQIKNLTYIEQKAIWNYIYGRFDELDDFLFIDDLVFLDQCTGLKDKNGKLIFEEDVIKCKHFIYKVTFNQKFASFVLVRKVDMFYHYFGEALEAEDAEIIGNIHENPELLDESEEE